MGQIKSYDDMFQAAEAMTIQKILKIIIFRQESYKMQVFSCFLLNALILKTVLQEKIQPYTSHH